MTTAREHHRRLDVRARPHPPRVRAAATPGQKCGRARPSASWTGSTGARRPLPRRRLRARARRCASWPRRVGPRGRVVGIDVDEDAGRGLAVGRLRDDGSPAVRVPSRTTWSR